MSSSTRYNLQYGLIWPGVG